VGGTLQPSRSYDGEELARALDALSNPIRLAILRAVEEPRCLSEIGIVPTGPSPGARLRGGILSRQTVKMHLDRLAAAGIVIAKTASRPNGQTTHYVLDRQSLLAISKAVDQLAQFFARQDCDFETAPALEAPMAAAVESA
jgi:DNA-binding transcriptional ArsR family regulator